MPTTEVEVDKVTIREINDAANHAEFYRCPHKDHTGCVVSIRQIVTVQHQR